ncbi:MAG: alpha-2-macroglobulin [Phycisphaerae bacterium]
MTTIRLFSVIPVLVVALLVVKVTGQEPAASPTTKGDEKALRARGQKLMKDGNWKDAYGVLSALALDPADAPKQVSDDLNDGLKCLRQLGRLDELDDFREGVIKAHADNWRLLQTAAWSYRNDEHSGHIVAGKFYRGYHRGAAKYVNSFERDRIRSLQLMQQAMDSAAKDNAKAEVANFYIQFADMLLGGRSYYEAWRLQYLTDLTTLPDYEDGYYYGSYGAKGAPVDEKGNPVYHYTPKSWKDAKTDGERWRWCLLQAMEASPSGVGPAKWALAEFCLNQFGVQTMAEYGWYFRRSESEDDTKKNESGTYELHLLKDDETIAKLATGIKRFKLPDEFNYIKLFEGLASETADYRRVDAMDQLAHIYENRRQYPTAAEWWRKAIKLSSGDQKKYREQALSQIVDNWGQFESMGTQPAGKGPEVDFRFRNGTKVSFEAFRIDAKLLLDDVKKYLKSNPKQLDWETINISNIGYRLVEKNLTKYLGESVANWDLELKPRPNHFDKRITVATPLQKAGAYLLVAKMADGNTSRIVLWVADTAIVKKPLEKGPYYFVADAVTGEPIAKANVEFFGYWQEWKHDDKTGASSYIVHTDDFAEFTDKDGQIFIKGERQKGSYSWVAIATTEDGRLAYLGFTGGWYNRTYDSEYNQRKTFLITDRPVYRPGHVVKYKFWMNQARYDAEDKSTYAGEKYTVRVMNPKNEKVQPDREVTLDEYGGADGEFALAKDAALGLYNISVIRGDTTYYGGLNFRVEEYKKPEFEVKVDAPTEPVMLGEKVEAKITSKYYFGAPVTEAKVKYKVLRSSYSSGWYPVMYWDWLYGPGYWWFGCDYPWYPGWREWGCKRPLPDWWWNWHPRERPEVVSEAEVPVGKDGVVKIEIDTAIAKEIYGDTDHKYEITAEVTDASRRTIVGTGNVLVARKPFKVYAWTQCGHYRVGQAIEAAFAARTLDGKPVKGKGELKLFKISYEKEKGDRLKPVETEVQKWALDTNDEGKASQKIDASAAGQFRLSYKLTDSKKHTIEGGYVFVIRGEGFDGKDFRFNDIELTADKKEYKPGEKIELMINTNQPDSTVLLFPRAANGVYLAPKVMRLKGKSVVETVEVLKKDMPNFFIEALTVTAGKVFTESREIVVPPEQRVLNVDVKPSSDKYKPGEKGKVTVKLTDPTGEPYKGSIVVSIYDKAVEYISGGSNIPDIKKFFWDWRRHHYPTTESSLDKTGWNITRSKEIAMAYLGVFGYSVADEVSEGEDRSGGPGGEGGGKGYGRGDKQEQAKLKDAAQPAAPSAKPQGANEDRAVLAGLSDDLKKNAEEAGPGGEAGVEPSVRSNFADTALWAGLLSTDERGLATVDVTMPENLTTWKTRVWAMGLGAKCGEGTAESVTTKNLIIRLQAPRFFVQKDEVVLSANVHNYLKDKKKVKAVLELEDNGCFDGTVVVGGKKYAFGKGKETNNAATGPAKEYLVSEQSIEVEPNGEKRVDWTIKVAGPGMALVRMKALTNEESDAMQMSFPVFIHGMLKTESFSGVIRPDKTEGSITINVPKERLPEQSRLEVRYSPTLAMAMVDALPYMEDYPYGCTEQTLNRFLPTVITQKVLLGMGLDLKDIQKKRTNLNTQEIGDDKTRAEDWKYRGGYMSRATAKVKEAVFDEDTLREMVKANINRLLNMQCSDGGWGWFSGWGEHSWPHTTAVVVHGLQIAKANDVALVPGMLERGVEWLKNYQAEEVRRLKLPKDDPRHKDKADNIDALVYMVLVDQDKANLDNKEMRDFLYRDRNNLAVYAKAMFGLALHRVGETEERDMLITNVEQFLVQDDENQTAFLKLPENNWWWCWYGSEIEADSYYLKLISAKLAQLAKLDDADRDEKRTAEIKSLGDKASRLVKYLLNNRKHATYWNSTRDTAVAIEAMADFLKASGEDKPNMTVELLVDGKSIKTVEITKDNLFSFDNKLVIAGADVKDGKHTVEFRKKGTGPLYFNAYLTNFTLEDPITKAGLEIKVNRKFYKLVELDAKEMAAGSRGQVVGKKIEKYKRVELASGDVLKSGDLVEIEMEIDSKNDYEYVMFEDMKAAGFEPVEVRSGYNGNDLGAYMELRDERVSFFVRQLARGKSSVAYRMRAEIPGKFSALPTKASAMYAPELKANSDEFKIGITD